MAFEVWDYQSYDNVNILIDQDFYKDAKKMIAA